MNQPEITATSGNLAELPEREQILPPEQHPAVNEAGREQVTPPEAEGERPKAHAAEAASADNVTVNVFNPEAPVPTHPITPTPTPTHPAADAAVHAPAVTGATIAPDATTTEVNPLLVSDEEIKVAEETLSRYLGENLAPGLLAGTKEHPNGIALSLSSAAQKDIALVLDVKGLNIDANYGTYESQIRAAIEKHPILAAVLPCGVANQSDGTNTLRFALGQLSPEQYASLIRQLAATPAVVHPAPSTPIKDAEITAATQGALPEVTQELSDVHVAPGGDFVDAQGQPQAINNADIKIAVPAAHKEVIKPQQQVVEV